MDSDGMIEARGLRVSLGDRAVLDCVDLCVEPGEIVALMGVSGSGKSTLLRSLVGLVELEAGEVSVAGHSMTKRDRSNLERIRRSSGMLFQGNALFDSMTVYGNVGFVLQEVLRLERSEIDARVAGLLERLRLGPISDKYPSELSGGMKKRVGIARAIAHNPRVVFYDDPTAGLDPITSRVIADLIAELSSGGRQSGLVVTNDLSVARRTADRAVLIRQGASLDLGPVHELSASDIPSLDASSLMEPDPQEKS
ncbi:MAG: ATP-binding cassette domain-containing protein [bacterium]